ncbi:MAG: hypothetical protein CMO74_02430 [Verrucomicrobiales bacterium]|nr:hypothetical protein [Verrucomicrobiales bacterium]
MHHVKNNAALFACILLAMMMAGCTSSMAKHTFRATGRFARASITSGGNFVGAAINTGIGTGIDIASAALTRAPAGGKLVTVIHPVTGVAQDLLWREGMTIYTARRALNITEAPATFALTRGKKTMAAVFDAALRPGDVVRWME